VATEGLEALFLETYNWGNAAKFFQALGYGAEFETAHTSSQLRSGDDPCLFIAEVPGDRDTGVGVVLKVSDAETFRPDPIVDVASPFGDTHWATKEMVVRDPEQRLWSLQVPGRG
jgi:uncharacterized glyoxalase superfamily protein PhnB